MSQHAVNYKMPPSNKALLDMTQLALAESANLLSQLSVSSIRLGVDAISIEQSSPLTAVLDSEKTEMLAVQHKVSGDKEGLIAFMLSQQSARQLLQGVLNVGGVMNELSEMDEEVLCEIGNIIVNHCLNHYVQIFHESVSTSLPQLMQRPQGKLLLDLFDASDETCAYVVKINVELGQQSFSACLLWLGHLCQLDAVQAQS